jgi:hypothetical protein
LDLSELKPTALPAALAHLPYLHCLDVNRNELQMGALLESPLLHAGALPELRSLSANDNALVGALPEGLGSLAPCLDAIAGEHPEKLAVYKVNVDQCIGLAQRYGVSSIPELKVFVDGKVVKSFGGAMSKRSLEVQLARWLW